MVVIRIGRKRRRQAWKIASRGALPLMLGTGTGSELRQPLGIAIIGGLIVSQMLTLFTTPVIYLWFDQAARRINERFSRGRDDDEPSAGPGPTPAPEGAPAT